MTHFVGRGAALAATLALLVTACGSDDDEGSATTDAPVETEAPVDTATPADTEAPVETEVPSEEQAALRIISLSPTHTEMLFAIGAGDQVVAVDDQSDYPEEVLDLPRDLSGFEPNVEAIAAYEPDLVVTGGDFTGLGEQLASVGIEAWDGPAAVTLDDSYSQIVELGEITGEAENAAALVADMQAEVDELVTSAPTFETPPTIYHELDPTLYSVTSSTFVGQLYNMVGLRNVADELETDAGPYPQLNAEFLVSSNPDLIFLADTECCGETVATVSARPGWDAITAIQTGAVFAMDEDLASRWGPRTVDYLADIVAALNEAGGS